VCKFGGDPAICVREEAICAKVYRRTDRQTDDRRRAIVLAHSWNELNNNSVKRTEATAATTSETFFCSDETSNL